MSNIPHLVWLILEFKEIPFTYLVMVFFLITGVIGMKNKRIYNKFRFHPYSVFKGERMHTLLTSAFIHNNLRHLIINMYVFYIMSYDLEYIILDRYNKWLTKAFLLCFLFSTTMIVNLANGWKNRKNVLWSSAGASGSMMALITFSMGYIPLDHAPKNSFSFPFYYGYEYCLAFLVISFLFTFKKSKNDHYAHFYGAILGAALAILIRPELINELYHHFC